MSLSPPQDYRKTEYIHRIGVASMRPAAGDVLVGTLYFASDTLVMSRSNGTSWDIYGGSGSLPAPSGGQIFIPGNDGIDGTDGFPGLIGPTGFTGNQGLIGPSGTDGEDGIGLIGPTGKTGNQGPQGIPGIDGIDGESLSGFDFPPYIAPAEFTTTATGNQIDFNFGNATILRCNNATLLTIQGLKPGAPGQKLTIKSVGAGQVNLTHQDAASSGNCKLINFTTTGPTPLAAGTGVAILEYDSTTTRWRLVHHEQGEWISIAYNAGDFTGHGTMTWTVDSGDLLTYRIWLKGRTLFINIAIANSVLGGTATSNLYLTLPMSYTTNGFLSFNVVLNVIDAGGPEAGEVVTSGPATSTLIQFWKLTEIAWNIGSGKAVFGTFPIEVL